MMKENHALTLYLIALKRVMLALGTLVAVTVMSTAAIVVGSFPYDTDAPLTAAEIQAQQKYYADAYLKPVGATTTNEDDTEYVRMSGVAAVAQRIDVQLTKFVKQYSLVDKAVLEIGSGRGNLQDVVDNYTGLDISPNVGRFYHKKFVLGSATALPFTDDSFDALWSVWVLEHVPNPEQALSEARRVTRNNGVMFLLPAWNVASWNADGYEVRPYSDFGLGGALIKISIPLRSSRPFLAATLWPVRVLRDYVARQGPTRLRYRRLAPNYKRYWVADGDAVNSIDSYELILWFTSRGDECLNCGDTSIFFPNANTPVIIRVHKR
jgi:SAM-dependent methyltransferase